jgi:hypothetical protein
MTPCLTHEDEAILSAQLEFVRRERRAQWVDTRAFRSFAGKPTIRQVRLTALCDAIGDGLLEYVRASDDWSRLAARGQLVAMRMTEHVVERVARFGVGITDDDLACLEASVRRTAPGDALWSAAGTRLLVAVRTPAGETVHWPAVVPASVILESLITARSSASHAEL